MNILVWILQVALALLNLAGGGFKISNPDYAAKVAPAIPPSGWRILGVFEVAAAVLLIVPAALNWMPNLTPLAAAALALETLVLAAVYARRSTKLVAANPLVYVIPMCVVALLVAYGRFALMG